jgi:DNA modification methylase
MTPIPQPALKPFFQDALSTLYHGPAVETMALLPAQSVDVVLTSPNYNVSLKYDIRRPGVRQGNQAMASGLQAPLEAHWPAVRRYRG